MENGMPSWRRWWRTAVPAGLLAALVCVMVGCIYVPTWERVQLTGAKQDFRPLLAANGAVAARVAAGRVTRADVERLLGPPPYATRDGRSAVYTLGTRRGLIVTPLCLDLTAARESQFAVRLEYGPDGVVTSYQTRTATNELRPPIWEIEAERPHGEFLSDHAAAALDGGNLEPTGVGTGLPLHEPRDEVIHYRGPTTRPGV